METAQDISLMNLPPSYIPEISTVLEPCDESNTLTLQAETGGYEIPMQYLNSQKLQRLRW